MNKTSKVILCLSFSMILWLNPWPQQLRNLFAQTASSLTDPLGDASPPYLDVLAAHVFQVGKNGLQFDMTVAGDIPFPVGQPYYDYMKFRWWVDTDQNPATGYKQRYVGSKYEVYLRRMKDYSTGSVNEVINPNSPVHRGFGQVFVRGNSVSISVLKDQLGNPTAFNWEIETFSSTSPQNDLANSYGTFVLSENSVPIKGITEVRMCPSEVSLSQGETSRLNAVALDEQGNRLPLDGRRVEFFSSLPSEASVDDSGTVTGISFGTPWITARVDGVLSSDHTWATVTVPEQYSLKPYNLHLSMAGTRTGQLRVYDGNGNEITQGLTFWGYQDNLISVSPLGLVTALRQETSTDDLGTEVYASVNGWPVDNSCIVRVLSKDYSLEFEEHHVGKTNLYSPVSVNGEDIESVFIKYQTPEVINYAYSVQSELIGTKPFHGADQIFELDFGDSPTGQICATSGNPIRLFWNLATNDTCSIQEYHPPEKYPNLGLLCHELGHNFTVDSNTFTSTIGRLDTYREGLAYYLSSLTPRRILDNAVDFPVNADARAMIAEFATKHWLYYYDKWRSAGAPFSGMDATVVAGILDHLESEAPPCFATRFFKLLRPDQSHKLCDVLPLIVDDSKRHTFFAAMCSAALGLDLHDLFANEYHFPLDEAFYSKALSANKEILASDLCTETVSTPNTPSGGNIGVTNNSCSYTTDGSISSFGHAVEYQFDWKGDGSDLSPWGPATQTKTWNIPGVYNVKARARCAANTSAVSGWSSGLSVTISAETVTTPNTPAGPTVGKDGLSYSYTTGGSTSNLGHIIEYQFDWKDDGSDLSNWGSASQTKTWTVPGAYNVKARARCTQDVSIISDWSNPLSVSISVPRISLSPTAYDYGNMKLKRSKTASFKVANTGKANLSITSTIKGADASMFKITSGSGNKTVKPGKTLTIKVAFKPTSRGSKASAMEITSNDPNVPTLDIPLGGTGQ